MSKFLLEIGSEEIPARFLKHEQEALKTLFENALKENHVIYKQLSTYATPRRLVLFLDKVEQEKQKEEKIITGPAVKIAYDEAGKPSKALIGFCQGQKASVEDVFVITTNKGEYAAIKKKEESKTLAQILSEICPKIISSLPFPKSMRWGNNVLIYARPIRWILALLDNNVIKFETGPIKSGALTYGHRILGPGPFSISSPEAYFSIIKTGGHVLVDSTERAKKIRELGDELVKPFNGKIIWKEELLDEVANLTECPVPVLGHFDQRYLDMPKEVLLTSMETHQKSFGTVGADGKLLPLFLTVSNIESELPEDVQKGWERVLKARLEDARFFWRDDIKQNADHWLEKLDNVIFIGKLGSLGDRSVRLQKLCVKIAEIVNYPEISLAAKAGLYSKVDLVSQMVGEFDTLQGIMGGIYLKQANENEEVANAIQEQYLPTGPASPLPQTKLGAILAIADKIDTLTGCFGLGMQPTGAADPNGLRRCALGIIRIILEYGWNINLNELAKYNFELYRDIKWKVPPQKALENLDEFILTRLRHYLTNSFEPLFVEAVLEVASDNLNDAIAKLTALEKFSKNPDFAEIAQTIKRIENITKKSQTAGDLKTDAENNKNMVKEELLHENAETELWQVLKIRLPNLDKLLEDKDYYNAMRNLAELKKPVDNFFNNVMVLAEDPLIRENRLSLLNLIKQRFSKIAKFSALQL